jgi:hypothetical protein
MRAGIEEFSRGMKALEPEDEPQRRRPAVPHRGDGEDEAG